MKSRLFYSAVLFCLTADLAAQDRQRIDTIVSEMAIWISGEDTEDADLLERLYDLMLNPVNLNHASRGELADVPFFDAQTASGIVRERRQSDFRSWSRVDSLLAQASLPPDLVRPFISIDLPPRTDVRGKRNRVWTGHLLTQAYTRRDQVGVLEGRGDPAILERHSQRFAITRKGTLWLRFASRRQDGGASHVGGARFSPVGERVTVTVGTLSAGFGQGLALSRTSMSDRWGLAGRAPALTGFGASPRTSISSTDSHRGIVVQVAPAASWSTGLLRTERRVSGRTGTWTGASLHRAGERLTAGILVLQVNFTESAPLSSRLHDLKRFSGPRRRLATGSVGYTDRLHAAGLDVAVTSDREVAALGSWRRQLASSVRVAGNLRYVSTGYPVAFGRNAAISASDGSGEIGLMLSMTFSKGAWRGSALADASRAAWSGRSSVWPGTAQEFRLQIERRARVAHVLARVMHRTEPADYVTELALGENLAGTSRSMQTRFRLQATIIATRAAAFRLHVEHTRSRRPLETPYQGLLVYQQVTWQPAPGLLVEARHASFAVADADARVYAHEGDVRLQPTVMSFSGDGERRYVRVKLEPGSRLSFEAKVSSTDRLDRPRQSQTLPSTTHRVEVRLQLAFLFR